MLRVTYTAFLTFMFSLAPLSGVGAVEQDSSQTPIAQTIFDNEEKGFSFEIAGNAEKEGALKLFLKDTTSKHETHDISADDLNRIAPAAGIKLEFDF